MDKRTLGIPGILLCLFIPALFAAELQVGKKVVYPGGVGQPPKEKDVGVKLKVELISATITADREATLDEDAMEDLLKEEKPGELLKALENQTDPVSEAYKALALQAVNRKQEARQKAKELIDSGECPDELKARMEALLSPRTPPQH